MMMTITMLQRKEGVATLSKDDLLDAMDGLIIDRFRILENRQIEYLLRWTNTTLKLSNLNVIKEHLKPKEILIYREGSALNDKSGDHHIGLIFDMPK